MKASGKSAESSLLKSWGLGSGGTTIVKITCRKKSSPQEPLSQKIQPPDNAGSSL
jgi:hypothetical protein